MDKPKLNRRKVRVFLLDCLIMVGLALLFAFNYELFIIENDFAPAGFNGIATMIEYKTHFSVGYFTLIINVPLCIFAFFCVSKDFALKTAVFSVSYALFVLLLGDSVKLIDLAPIRYYTNGVDTIFPALIAGATGGFVYGIAFRRNSSTGGADIVAKYVSIRDPMLNFFWINFAINAAIAFASLFVYTESGTGEGIVNYKPVCLCMLYCFLSSYVGNAIIKGSKTAYKFFIVTTHAEEIDAEIIKKLHHGATKLQGKGVYSNGDRTVIVCVVNKRQLVDFRNILKNYDDTFAFVETVNETFGSFAKVK